MCVVCYDDHCKRRAENDKKKLSTLERCRVENARVLDMDDCTPVRVVRPERRRSSPTMAVPGRSAHVSDAVAAVATKLGANAAVPVDRLLAALVSPAMARCGLELSDGTYCIGMRGIIERDCTKVGSRITLTFKCSSCCARTSIVSSTDTGMVSVPDNEGGTVKFRKESMRQVLQVLLAGSTYAQYKAMVPAGIGVISETQFFKIQRVLIHAIMATSKEYFDAFRKQMADDLKERGDKWVASADGAWSHRGWRARQHTYLVRDFSQNTVVCCVVLKKDHIVSIQDESGNWVEKSRAPGNYVGTSKGMEGEAFAVAMQELTSSGLNSVLDKIVLDGDSGVRHLLEASGDFKGVGVAGDPGHRKKNFAKALVKVFPVGGKYALYPWRISMFFIRCLKRAEKDFEGFTEEAMTNRRNRFEELWQHAYAHYTRQYCTPECPCQHNEKNEEDETRGNEDADGARIREVNALMGLLDLQDAAEDDQGGEIDLQEAVLVQPSTQGEVQEMTGGKKDWLNPSNEKEAKMCAQLVPLLAQAAADVGDILWGINTCMSECSNSRRLKFCRKDRYFYASYEARSTVSAMLENLSPVEVLDRVYVHFGFVFDENDEEIRERLTELQERRTVDSERKRSVEFKRRAGALNKKIATERRQELVADKRSSGVGKRAYNKEAEKVLGADHPLGIAKKPKIVKQTNPFSGGRRAGKASQKELQRRMATGERVMKCGHCGTLYQKTHKTCSTGSSRGNKGGAKQAVSDYSFEQLEEMLGLGKVKKCPKDGCGEFYFSRHHGCRAAGGAAKKQKTAAAKPKRARVVGHENHELVGLAASRSRRNANARNWSDLVGGSAEEEEEDDGGAFGIEADCGDAGESDVVRQEQSIIAFAEENDLTINPRVLGDGNCFFSATSFQLLLIGRNISAASLRREVVANVNTMELEVLGLRVVFQEAAADAQYSIENLEDWAHYMSRDRVWADELCLRSTVDLYNIRIRVVRARHGGGGVNETVYGENGPQIILGYTPDRHYYSLEPLRVEKRKK